jgi:aspartate kinase
MSLLVQKYGGTSVADTARVKAVAKQIVEEKLKGHDIVAVVSAPAGITDQLISRAKEISNKPCRREMDVLLSTGEQINIALLAMAIKELGHEAVSYTAGQIGIKTTKHHNRAKITSIDTKRIRESLDKKHIVIVAGFQGVSEDNDYTTLGRGGSDTTGVALGVALGVKNVDIFTDVDGVYTADPRIVKNAKKIEEICYEEMLELSATGAKVLHSRSVEIAYKNNISVHLRSSFEDKKGTLIHGGVKNMENCVIRGISHSEHEARITIKGVPDEAGIAARIFNYIAKENINIDIIVQGGGKGNYNDVSFIVKEDNFDEAMKLSREAASEVGASGVEGSKDVAMISVVGVGIKSNSGVAAKIFEAFGREKINIDMISSSEIKVSCVIERKDMERAINALHKQFID